MDRRNRHSVKNFATALLRPWLGVVSGLMVFLISSAVLASQTHNDVGLSHSTAQERSALIRKLAYNLRFDLTQVQDSQTYHGQVQLSFDLTQIPAQLSLDFFHGEIKAARINGHSFSIKRDPYRLFLPGHLLKTRGNKVTLDFDHGYSQEGGGFYRFVDPLDQQVYLYTDFEPFDANKMFPLFDQPDLKATFEVTVVAPAEMQFISTVRESSIKSQDQTKIWHFPASLPISSYVFALHGGAFTVFQESFRIPLRLFVRKSMAPFVDVKEWFLVTKAGFDYYEAYLDSPYPFGKYDQILVPHFNAGAMENVAAVTFNEERYVKRGKVKQDDRRRMYATLLHEMAHMWFGDLVTPTWWNDLWLNESFATFMATQAMAASTPFQDGWRSFSGPSMTEAYRTDETNYSRPIAFEVGSSQDATAIFDSITYAKGGQVLRQLAFLMGDDSFRQVLRTYLKSYRFHHARSRDFLAMIGRYSKVDSDRFTRDFISSSGVTTLRAAFDCQGPVLTSLRLAQSAQPQQLRRFRTKVGLFHSQDPKNSEAKQKLTSEIVVDMDQAIVDVAFAPGTSCPEYVYPNYDGYAYVKVQLDSRSLNQALKDPMGFANPAWRDQVGFALEDEVRAGRMPLEVWQQALVSRLAKEDDLASIKYLLNGLHDQIKLLVLTSSTRSAQPSSPSALEGLAAKISDPELWQQQSLEIEAILKRRWQSADPGSDLQYWFFDSWVEHNRSQDGVSLMAKLIQEPAVAGSFGIALDWDRQWSLISRLAELKHPMAQAWQQRLAGQDHSERGELANLAIDLIRADDKSRISSVLRAINPEVAMSAKQRVTLVKTLTRPGLAATRFALRPGLEAQFNKIASGFGAGLAGRLVAALLPPACHPDSIQWAQGFLRDPLPAPLVKTLKIFIEDERLCLTIAGRGATH